MDLVHLSPDPGPRTEPNIDRIRNSSREEAKAYLQHPVLGPRLKECTRLVILVEGRSAHEIFGSPDDMKFRSSMTLFAEVSPDDDIFKRALLKYFNGEPDPHTVDRL